MTEKQSKVTLFIADLHLTSINEVAADKFLAFLRGINREKTAALYILGDLFTMWTGDDNNSLFNQHIKVALKELTSAKLPVFTMPGNRDFLLGEKFAKETGATLLKDPHIMDLYSRKTLLTHGDSLCINDLSHQRIHAVIRNKTIRSIFLHLPIFIRAILGWAVEALCAIRKKVPRYTMTDMVKEASIATAKKYQVSQIIHGHLHREEVDEFKVGTTTVRRICVGDWLKDQSSILVYATTGNYSFIRNNQ